MAAMLRLGRSARSALDRLFRLVALFAWVGQLAVLCAPLVEAHAGPTIGPHVESESNPLHHAHTPELCPACSALALVGRLETPNGLAPRATIVRSPFADEPRVALNVLCLPAALPRAPPACESETAIAQLLTDSHARTSHAFGTLAVRALVERDGPRTRAATTARHDAHPA